MIRSKETDKKGNRLFEVTEQPSVEPITVDEVKLWARIDGTDEDTVLSEMIKSIRRQVELYIHRSLIKQKIEMILDFWPDREVELPMGKIVSFEKIELLDQDGNVTEYDSDNYYLAGGIPDKVVIKYNEDVPDPQDVGDRMVGGMKLIWYSGYGETAADIPQTIKDAMKLWVTFVYENRVMNPKPPLECETLLRQFRILNTG